MNCYKCGQIIFNSDDKFCSNCGTKLKGHESSSIHNISSLNSKKSLKDDSTTFLIIGIVLSMCCCLPLGISVILINELKYKKLLSDGIVEEANKIKTIMIILICVGIIIFFLLQILNILLTLVEVGANSNVYI